MISKDFTQWNNDKVHLHNNKNRPLYQEREIWYTKLGLNIGFEQDGKGDKFIRPVLILKKFNREVCWVLPLTSKVKFNKYHFLLNMTNNYIRKSSVILSQIRLVDSKRLHYRIARISEFNFDEIKTKIKELLP